MNPYAEIRKAFLEIIEDRPKPRALFNILITGAKDFETYWVEMPRDSLVYVTKAKDVTKSFWLCYQGIIAFSEAVEQ